MADDEDDAPEQRVSARIENVHRLRRKYFSQTILPWRYALWKAMTYIRTFVLAYLVVFIGQMAMCALEHDTELQVRGLRLDLQRRLQQELSNETYALLLQNGFDEVREHEHLAWDFDGAFHTRSLMFSFTLVASIGYGDLYPRTDGGRVFCILFTLVATPALVVNYLFAARKLINFMRFLAMLMDEQNIKTFHKYDRDDSGQLNSNEFKIALNDLGYPVGDDDVRIIMEEVNICDTSLVTIEEFGQAMILLEFPDAKYAKAKQTALLVFASTLAWLLLGTFCFMRIESWTFVESLWFCWETSMTIGLGDIIPQTTAGRIFNLIYSFIGLGQLSLLLQTLVDLLTKHTSVLGRLEMRLLEGQTPSVQDMKKVRRAQKQVKKRLGMLQAWRRSDTSLATSLRGASMDAKESGRNETPGASEAALPSAEGAEDGEDEAESGSSYVHV